MPIEKELLWEAWPEGYLAIQGVSTVGGWQYLGESPGGQRWFRNKPGLHLLRAHKENGEYPAHWPGGWFATDLRVPEKPHKSGDLLPNVDPTDVATWACLLQDLAEAAGLAVVKNLTWRTPGREMGPMTWLLSGDDFAIGDGLAEFAVIASRAFSADGGEALERAVNAMVARMVDFDIDTDDPAEALILARIQLRKDQK